MNNKNYYQCIWSTLLNCFNYRSKAGRTEFVYFWLFFYSYSLLNPILFLFVYKYPIVTTLYSIYLVFSLWGTLSMIALVFRRCRDIGYSSLAVLYVLFYLIQLRVYITGAIESNSLFLVKYVIYSIPTFILIPFMILVKGKYKEIEYKDSFCVSKINKRYAILAITTLAFLLSLFVFHLNYEYTNWWIDEWIIVSCAVGLYLVALAIYCILYLRKIKPEENGQEG